MRFFRKQPRNRRLTRDYVLDVKLSASQRRQNRLRRLVLVLASFLILGVAGFIVWRVGESALRQYVYENPAFWIRNLQTETDGVLSAEQIQTWAGLKLRENVLAVDLARVERDLKLVPAIEAV